MKVAELICQTCGTVSYTGVPSYRTDTMPRCRCGGMRQVIRVIAARDADAAESASRIGRSTKSR